MMIIVCAILGAIVLPLALVIKFAFEICYCNNRTFLQRIYCKKTSFSLVRQGFIGYPRIERAEARLTLI